MKFIRELMEKQWEETGLSKFMDDEPDTDPKKRSIARMRKQPGHEFVGAGANAYVSKNTSPHEMDNVRRTSGVEDATGRYLKWLNDNPEAAQNPYFPRVLGYRQGNALSKAKLERLIPFDSPNMLSWPLLTSTWEHMFDDPAPTHEFLNADYGETLSDKNALEQFAGMFAEKLKLVLVGDQSHRKFPQPLPKIIDPQLQQAMDILADIKEDGYPDLHLGNIMWRVTGNRPQLVITDPFS